MRRQRPKSDRKCAERLFPDDLRHSRIASPHYVVAHVDPGPSRFLVIRYGKKNPEDNNH